MGDNIDATVDTTPDVKLRHSGEASAASKKKARRSIRVSSMIRSASSSEDDPDEGREKPQFMKKVSRENSLRSADSKPVVIPSPTTTATTTATPTTNVFSEDGYSTVAENETDYCETEDGYSTVT